MTIEQALALYKTGSGRIESGADSLLVGVQVTVVGLLIVFSVLLILMFILKLMKVIFAPKEEKVKENPIEEKAAPAVPLEANAQDDEEIVAVLTAAIAASLNTSTYNLKIKSFRRIGNNSPAWNKAGLSETINSRF